MPDPQDMKREIAAEFEAFRRDFGIELPDPSHASTPVASPPSPAIPQVEVVAPEDDTYPGSRHTRRSVTETEDDEEASGWDANPRSYVVDGARVVEFFTISALATALNRGSATLRTWEDKGYLPRAAYRVPTKSPTDRWGNPNLSRHRLYTRAQVEGLMALAKEEGLMEARKKYRIDQTKFPARAHRLFAALAAG